MGRRQRLDSAESTAVPDHLRCRRNDGKKWRCPLPSLPNISFCSHHHLQSRNNVARNKLPSERPSTVPKGTKRTKRTGPKGTKRTKLAEESEGWSEKMMDELVRLAVRRMVAKERNPRRLEAKERRLVLPNGVMAIAPPSRPSIHNAGLQLKLDPDRRSFLERCFRSKNCDPPPPGFKKLPIGRRRRKGAKVTRKVCHLCKEKASKSVQCSECRKFYCIGCAETADNEINALEVSRDCSHHHAACSCKTSITPGAILRNKKCTNFRNEISISHKHHMSMELLSTQKHSEHEQLMDMGIDSNKEGGRFSDIWCKLAESNHDRPFNCLCGTSITEARRFCSTCSFKLCLSCFYKKHHRRSKEVTTHSLAHSDRRKAYEHIAKEKVGTDVETFSWCHPCMPFLHASRVSSEPKFKKTSRRTCFPSKTLQDSVLVF